MSNLGIEAQVPESSTDVNSTCRSKKLGKNDQETGHRVLAKEQQEPGVCEFGLPLGSQPLQVTGNSPHEEVIELSLDAKKKKKKKKKKRNVRLGAKLCTGISSVDGNGEVTTLVVNAMVCG